MENIVAVVVLIENHRNEINEVNITRRNLRDTSDPFSQTDTQFRDLYRNVFLIQKLLSNTNILNNYLINFRLSKESTRALIEELRPWLPARQRATGVPCELMILAALSFMASGSYQRRIGQDYLTCMSQTKISDSLHATVHGLNQLMRRWIRFPISEERRQQIKERFYVNTGFPGTIGAVDGTHVAIFPPQVEREHLFVNRKQYYSLNVMIVSDYDGEILAVNASHGGRTHDSRVFRSSQLYRHLQEQFRHGVTDWLIGDSGYPLLPFLLTPKLHEPPGTPAANFTEHHIRARCCVERCIGVLKGRWRCLRKERGLHYQPEFAALIVNACCVLHNIAKRWGIPPEDEYFDPIDQQQPLDGRDDDLPDGRDIRNRVIQLYFAN